MSANTRNLAILFADVAGSTGLYQKYGDVRALAAIDSCIGVMRAVTSQLNGRVIKTIGDEVMAVFDTPEDAFCASCEMQWRVMDLPWCGSDRTEVRIGFHYGQTLQQNDDVFGDSVNIAARLVGIAKAGQILTSGRTFDVIGRAHSAHMRKLNSLTLRGMSHSETIYEGLWQDDENITALLSGTLAQPRVDAEAKLRYGGVRIDFDPQCKRMTFGRDPVNTVVVSSRKASRVHARIERRRDKLILIDQSANGTFITDERGRDSVLRLEEMSLRGHGFVSFGEPVVAGSAGLLEYSLDDDRHAAADPSHVAAETG
jgi:adenylate cyclase